MKRLAHAGGCAGLEGVNVVPRCGHERIKLICMCF